MAQSLRKVENNIKDLSSYPGFEVNLNLESLLTLNVENQHADWDLVPPFTTQTVQTVLLSLFSVFIFSMPSKVILIVIEFMFLGINMFWALLRLILARAARRGLK